MRRSRAATVREPRRVGAWSRAARRSMVVGTGLALVGAILACAAFAGEEGPPLTFPELYHKMSAAVVTPHIEWAKPWPGKRLKALIIAPCWGQRETVELMQRMEIECVPFFVYSAEKLYCTADGWGHEKPLVIKKEAALKELAAKLQESFDVIVIGMTPAKDFPHEAVEALLAKVRAGTGLVYLWPKHAPNAALSEQLQGEKKEPAGVPLDYLVTGVPFEALKGFQIRDRKKDLPAILTLSDYGKGRVAQVQYRGSGGYEGHVLTPADSDDLNYEYYQSFLIKAILWAAQQVPVVTFENLPARVQAGQPLGFVLRNSGEQMEATVSLAIRSPDILHKLPEAPWADFGVHQTAPLLRPVFARQETVALPKGAKEMSLALPDLPEGAYFADVEIAAAQGKVNWATTLLAVPEQVAISRITLTPETIVLADAAPEPLKIAVELAKPAPEGAVVRLALLDGFDRLLDRQELKLANGAQTAEAALAATGAATTLLKARAELAVGPRVLSVKSARATATGRGWDAFTFFAWGGPGGEYVGRQRFRELAALGVEAVRGGASLQSLEVADVRTISDLCRFNGNVDKATNRVVPCYSSESFRAGLQKSIQTAVARDARFDSFGYLLGDEFQYTNGGLTGACCSETCVKRLAAFLKERYRNVKALNRQWDSSYKSFDEVLGLGHPQNKDKDAQTEAMRRTGNYSRLIDEWLSNYATFADAIHFCREELQRLAPGVRLGISTPLWNFYYRGYDWPNIMANLNYATPYGPWGDYSDCESIRSFARPGTILSLHYGSYVEPCLNDEEHFGMVPYAILLRGGANVFWYTTWGNEGGISPWLDPYPCLRCSSEEIRKIKAGAGRLLLGARRNNGGIAIHYSQASFLFSFAVSGPSVPWRINALVEALHDLGQQFDLVSSAQVLDGALAKYRVLFMPVSQCVGDEEAGRIREFVEHGGLAIADLRPGIADGHGKVGAQKSISRLFGLKWGPELANDPEPDAKRKERLRPLKETKVSFSGTYAGKAFRGPETEKVPVDPVPGDDGAETVLSQDGVPLLTRRTRGKGAAVCLNFDVYPASPALAANVRNVLGTILSAHGLEPQVVVADRDEAFGPAAWVPGLEVARFDDGDAAYFGLVRRKLFTSDDAKAGLVQLRLPAKAELYDMRAGKYLGATDKLDLAVQPSAAKLYAALPYKVETLRIALTQGTCAPGQRVEATATVVTDGKPSGRHIIHLEALRPDGQAARYLGRTVEAAGGKAKFEIPFCLNEPLGEWQLIFTEAATGVRSTVKVTLAAASPEFPRKGAR